MEPPERIRQADDRTHHCQRLAGAPSAREGSDGADGLVSLPRPSVEDEGSPAPKFEGVGLSSCLCGGFHGANEGVVRQTHVTPRRLWAGVSEDGSDGQ